MLFNTLSLRGKMIVALFFAALILIGTSYSALNLTVRSGFTALEDDEARRNLERVERAVHAEARAFSRSANDWANWDETAEFVKGNKPDFPDINVSPSVLKDLDVEVMLVFRADGSQAYSVFNDNGTLVVPAPADLLSDLEITAMAPDSQGLILSGRGPVLVVSRTIHPTDRSGSGVGTLVWMHVLDDKLRDNIQDRIQLPVEVSTAFDAGEDKQHKVDQDRRIASVVLKDVHGHPAIKVTVLMDRKITDLGSHTVVLSLSALLLTWLADVCIIAFLMQRLVLSPIRELTTKVLSIDFPDTGFAAPALVRRGDEIGALARAFDGLLAHLEELLVGAENARQDALRASHAKSEFLAGMSHELRTPLNAILGFSEIIQAALFGPVSGKYREYATDIHRSGQHLLTIINDVLDMAKAEAHQIVLHKEVVGLAETVGTCIKLVQKGADDGQVVLEDSVPETLAVEADPLRVRQILLNLLSNAVKFTAPGGVIRVAAQGRADGWIELTVSDTGIGMSDSDLSKALEPFGQVDSALSRRHSGTGLGLPLACKFMAAHGGSLSIRSAPGRGTIATAAFPPGGDHPGKLLDEASVRSLVGIAG